MTSNRFPSDGPDASRAARLVVVRGEQVGRRVSVEGAVVLGRGHEAHLQFDDPEVSRQHARIAALDGEGFVVEDLGSRNGTQLNGRRIHRATLKFGDEIGLGSRVGLRFEQRDPAEDHAIRQQRLQALGRLSAGVAHDVNNMLSAIGANVDWLRGLPETANLNDAEVRESLADIATAALRASELTRGVISFARGQGRGRGRVDLSALSTEVLRLLRHSLPRDIELQADIMPNIFIQGDRVELHQVLMNLCLNARDAMPDGGPLHVSLTFSPPSVLEGLPLATDGPHAVLAVQDSGVGMDEQTRHRVFEPFFSTKGEGAGFGLGLATVREVVSYHQGYVTVDSKPGRGSVFTIYLPARLGRAKEMWMAATIERPGPRLADPTLGSLVLIVDDEAVVQRSIARLLRRGGYDVVEASSGREALDQYDHSRRRPDLVLLDMDMPGLSGEETLTALQRIDPSVRVVVMSGDHERGACLEGTLGAVGKPCDARTLIETVRGALLGEPDSEMTRPK